MFQPQYSSSEAFSERLKGIDAANIRLKALCFPRKAAQQYSREVLATSIFRIAHLSDPQIGYGRVVRALEEKHRTRQSANDEQRLILSINSKLLEIGAPDTNGRILNEAFFLRISKEILSLGGGGASSSGENWREAATPFRTSPKEVRETPQKRLYAAADHREVPALTSDLLDWICYESKKVHPLIKAIIAYFQILIIRPFHHSNAILGWFLFLTILRDHGLDFGKYVSLEKAVFTTEERFINEILRMIATSFNKGHFSASNFQPYLLHLLPVLESVIVEKKIELEREHPRVVGEMLHRAQLNPRQQKALSFTARNERITNREYLSINSRKSRKLAWEELNRMVDYELFKKVDQGRNTAYMLSDILLEQTIRKQLVNV